MKLAVWNVRGLNGPLTQNKVANLCWQHKVCIFGLLETKVKYDKLPLIMRRKFWDWNYTSNHLNSEGGRIVIIWDPLLVDCNVIHTTSQIIHCNIKCKITQNSFQCSFVYGLHTIVDRRDLWNTLRALN